LPGLEYVGNMRTRGTLFLVAGVFLAVFIWVHAVHASDSSTPAIQNVKAKPSLNTNDQVKVTVSWSTDLPTSTGLVEYGAQPGVYAGRQAQIQRLERDGVRHGTVLWNLLGNTKYYYRIVVTNEDGRTVTSRERRFTTPVTELRFQGIKVIAKSSNRAVIAFTMSREFYPVGINASVGTAPDALTTTFVNLVGDDSRTKKAHVILKAYEDGYKSLEPKTTYYVRINVVRNTVDLDSVSSKLIKFTTNAETKITKVSPRSGRYGSTVTITGRNFGVRQSPEVRQAVSIGCTLAAWPKKTPSCLAKVLSWENDKIVVRLDGGEMTGPVYLSRAVVVSDDSETVYLVRGPKLTVRR